MQINRKLTASFKLEICLNYVIYHFIIVFTYTHYFPHIPTLHVFHSKYKKKKTTGITKTNFDVLRTLFFFVNF